MNHSQGGYPSQKLASLEIAATESVNDAAIIPGEMGPLFLLPDVLNHLRPLIVSYFELIVADNRVKSQSLRTTNNKKVHKTMMIL